MSDSLKHRRVATPRGRALIVGGLTRLTAAAGVVDETLFCLYGSAGFSVFSFRWRGRRSHRAESQTLRGVRSHSTNAGVSDGDRVFDAWLTARRSAAFVGRSGNVGVLLFWKIPKGNRPLLEPPSVPPRTSAEFPKPLKPVINGFERIGRGSISCETKVLCVHRTVINVLDIRCLLGPTGFGSVDSADDFACGRMGNFFYW